MQTIPGRSAILVTGGKPAVGPPVPYTGLMPQHAEPHSDAGLNMEAGAQPIVFFDGECALCSRFVQWIIARDRQQQFRFAPLQGETAAKVIGTPEGDPQEWTVVLLDDDGTHERSDAVLRIMRRLGGVWGMIGLCRIMPRFLRDRMYRFIARRRFRWFGTADHCRAPTDEKRSRFLP